MSTVRAALEAALTALPDSDTGGPSGAGYKYAWDELNGEEQDWVKGIRAQITAALATLTTASEAHGPCVPKVTFDALLANHEHLVMQLREAARAAARVEARLTDVDEELARLANSITGAQR